MQRIKRIPNIITKENLQHREKDKKESKKISRNYKTSNKMALNVHLSIITLNGNGVNTPIKRHRMGQLGGTDGCLCE